MHVYIYIYILFTIHLYMYIDGGSQSLKRWIGFIYSLLNGRIGTMIPNESLIFREVQKLPDFFEGGMRLGNTACNLPVLCTKQFFWAIFCDPIMIRNKLAASIIRHPQTNVRVEGAVKKTTMCFVSGQTTNYLKSPQFWTDLMIAMHLGTEFMTISLSSFREVVTSKWHVLVLTC